MEDQQCQLDYVLSASCHDFLKRNLHKYRRIGKLKYYSHLTHK